MLRLVLAPILVVLLALSAAAERLPADRGADPVRDLAEAMDVPAALAVIGREGLVYGADLDRTFLDGQGGSSWQAEVGRIYDGDRLRRLFEKPFSRALRRSDANVDAMMAFLRSPLGRKSLALQLSAREAMGDDDIRQSEQERVARLEQANDSCSRSLERFAERNHLIDMNVQSVMNANIAFLRGLASAAPGGVSGMSEKEILASVWASEGEVRRSSRDWLMAFLCRALSPLSEDELRAYMDFNESPEGRVLNQALFVAYDALFAEVSHDLGVAVGRRAQETNL